MNNKRVKILFLYTFAVYSYLITYYHSDISSRIKYTLLLLYIGTLRLSCIAINLVEIEKTAIKGRVVTAMTTIRYDFIQ